MRDENYTAIVLKANIKAHPNADRLNICEANHYTVIVGLDIKQDDLVLFFEVGTQLSEEFCEKNKLFEEQGGYFNRKRLVKALNLRGVKSEGFILPLSSLVDFNGGNISKLKEGQELDTWNGKQFCSKYIPIAAGTENQRKSKFNFINWLKRKLGFDITNKMDFTIIGSFPEHIETGNFKRSYKAIENGSILEYTEKLEGTSHRLGLFLTEENKLKFGPKFLKKRFGKKIIPRIVHGTRRTILNPKIKDSSNLFRYNATSHITLEKLNLNEIIYGEIVGWMGAKPIVKPFSTKSSKVLEKKFGQYVFFKYGLPVTESKFYVYRITQDGKELTSNQVIKRCNELGLDYVPVIGYPDIVVDDQEALYKKVEDLTNGEEGYTTSALCESHIKEGIIVRVESSRGTYFLKNKSFAYKILKGKALEEGVLDLETQEDSVTTNSNE